jgi:RND superfamily putative drug exporter
MIRVADFCYRHRRMVLVSWVVALILVIAVGSSLPARHRANYQTPGAEATKAYQVLGEQFPAQGGDSIKIVFAGDLSDPAVKARAEAVLQTASEQPHVTSIQSPFDAANASQISQNGRIAYAQVNFDTTFDKLANENANYQAEFIDAIGPGVQDGLNVQISSFVAAGALGSEVIGFIFAAFILLIAFGSALAAGLPLITALFGLAIGATLGGVASRFVETPDWAATVATMIGLGVGIDYALFIITRYRNALSEGSVPHEAVLASMGTAGRAVLFAGSTVVIALLGMLTMGLSYLHGVVASSVIAVLATLAASLTLLPAILGFVGRNIDRWRVPFTGRASHQGEQAIWFRWSRIVQRHPWMAFFSAAVILLVLTLPLFSLRLGFPDDGNNPKDETSRQAYDLLTEGFGPGFNGPLTVVVDTSGANDGAAAVAGVTSALGKTPGVAFVADPVTSPSGDAALITVIPTTKPQEKTTEQLVHRMRDDVLPQALGSSGATAYVGGATAISIDQSNYIGARLPLFIGAVVFLSFLLLTMVFRSPLVALKAGIMNLLSIAAAYGVMAYAVHGTWFGSMLRIPETPVPAFVPMINFAILFGLSMDYEVFLLSRIREEYLTTGDNGLAVADGLAKTARVITAAAAIMVFVFGVFIFDPSTFIKQIGLGLAAAVFIDATLVRMVLVPATMELLGDANWWMPKWLDRILPNVHIEGEGVEDPELAALLAEERELV